MSGLDPEREPIDVLVEEFAERCRAGEEPAISEYVERYPELADDIRDLFPSVAMLEQVKQDDDSGRTAATVPAGLLGVPPLEQLGDFRIVKEIGRGGMGIVYEAEQQSLGRRVALKVLPAGSLVSAQQVQRFQREAQAAARLHHTSIVPVFGVGEQDGIHYYVMQFIEGQGLDQGLHGPTHGTDEYWKAIGRIGRQVANALDHAHGQGVLHRDVKPANLITDTTGTVWITDFGLARLAEQDGLTQSGDVIGTIRYMAPEQFKGEADARSDIYALGLTLYELLTLRPAHDESDRGQLIRQVIHEEPPRPRGINAAIPADLETIVLKCTAREPGRRYQAAAELAEDFRLYLEGRAIRARKTTYLGHLGLWCRRNPAIAGTSLAALALLVVASALGWVGYVRTNQALERESRQLKLTESARVRTEAAHKQAEAERRRAEANLGLAIQAFDEVFDQISIGPPGASALDSWEGRPAFQPAVSTRDAAILQNLLKFYGRFAEENRDDPALQLETAKAHRRVTQIHNRLGQFEEAAAACRAALAIYEGLSGRSEGREPDWDARAELHQELGLALQMTGKHQQARDCYNQALRILRERQTSPSGEAELKFAMAQIYQRLGSVPSGGAPREGVGADRRRTRDDEASTRTALGLLGELVAAEPENHTYRHAQALAYRNLAAMHIREGRQGEADTAADRGIGLLSRLAKEFPSVPDYRYDLVLACTLEPSAPRPRSEGPRAPSPAWKDWYRTALETARELVSSHPGIPAYQAAMGRACMRNADSFQRERKDGDAERCLRDAVSALRPLAGGGATASAYVGDYLRATQSLARLLEKRGELDRGKALLEESIAIAERALKTGPQRRREWEDLARQYGVLDAICSKLGEASRAEEARRRATQISREQRPDPRPREPGGPPPPRR